MIRNLVQKTVSHVLRLTGLQYFPVRVRSGLAAGARWTLYPWSAYWRGTQEPGMHRALKSLGATSGWSCWDLGAHYGIYSIGLARLVGPTGQVAAFEPNPLSFARLQRHRAMNGLTWMKAFNAAVSDVTAERELYTYGQLESTTTHLPYAGETPGADTKPIRIQSVALDALVAQGEIRLPQIMKVDIEGHGHHALMGAKDSIRAALPIIIMGFHSELEVRGTCELLDPLGYTWEPLEPNPPADRVGVDFVLRPPAR